MEKISKILQKLLIYFFLFAFVFIQNIFSQSTFSSERLQTAVEQFIKSKFGETAKIELLISLNNFKFKENDVKASISFDEQQANQIQHLFLSFYSDNDLLRTIDIPFRVKVLQKVVVAKHDILANSIISENDLILVSKEVTNVNDILKELKTATNKLTKRRLKAGEVVKENDLQNPKIIKIGQNIDIVVISGAVKIYSTATALQDGAEGDTIRVRRNTDLSNIVLKGTVKLDGTVQINL
jgi:flagella basal body P-ring formation protein FlgA